MANRESSKSAPPEAKRRKIDFSAEITVLIGPEEKRFRAPKDVLTRTSEFFQACTRGMWQEASSQTIKLPEVNAESFSVYLQWLYTGTIVISDEHLDDKKIGKDLNKKDRSQLALDHFGALFQLAILGDQLGDLTLSNATIDAILRTNQLLGYGPTVADVRVAYENLPESSSLRCLVVDYYSYVVDPSFMTQNGKECPSEFIFDIMLCLKENAVAAKRATRSYPGARCQYHQHNDQVPKCT